MLSALSAAFTIHRAAIQAGLKATALPQSIQCHPRLVLAIPACHSILTSVSMLVACMCMVSLNTHLWYLWQLAGPPHT
jgi:hypothetical protein